MKVLFTILMAFLTGVALAQADLDFQTTQGGWTTASLTKAYTGVGTPAVNVNVAIGGITDGLLSNSPQAFSRGLQLAVNHTTNTNCVSVTFTFSPAVQGLTFKLFNVDKAVGPGPTLYNFVDKVTVSAAYAGGAVTPAISASGSAGTYSTISGNTVTGTADGPAIASDAGNMVTFAGAVSQVEIAYCNEPTSTTANPGTQTMTIEDLSWSGVLPVGLVGFQVKSLAGQAAVSWQTAWEQNNSFFEVQRSSDAHEFATVGQVKAATQQAGGHNYSFLDVDPLPGTAYYRLRQTDNDVAQTSTYSQIVAFSPELETPELTVLGNPCAGESIQVETRHIEGQQLSLHSSSGRPIPTKISQLTSHRVQLTPLNQLVPGVYLLTGQFGQKRLTQKIVVQ